MMVMTAKVDKKKIILVLAGAAVLIAVLIMLFGGFLLGPKILLASFIGLLIKGFGVDFVIAQIVHMREKQSGRD